MNKHENLANMYQEEWFEYAKKLPTIGEAWLSCSKRMGRKPIMMELGGNKFSGYRTIAVTATFAQMLKPIFKNEQNIGILLPTSIGGILANLAVYSMGKTTVNLNYTSNSDAFIHMLEIAEIKHVLTSRLFLNKLKDHRGIKLDDVLKDLNVIYLEDLKAKIKKPLYIKNALAARTLPIAVLKKLFVKKVNNSEVANISFSSGSENLPKGIMLTHQNMMANIHQTSSTLQIAKNDKMLASLPLFHVFGLTITTILPLVSGTSIVCQPDPTDAMAVAKAVKRYNVTVLCGTSTFFHIYIKSRKVHPEHFESLRIVVAGAEKLSNSVRLKFKEKFNVDVLEGYGATEVSPVISSNLPNIVDENNKITTRRHKLNTVGRAIPGTDVKIVCPDTFIPLPNGEAGMIIVSGPQVMKGYLKEKQKSADVLLNLDNRIWYKTGDKGTLDDDGFITIIDRYSRFAKIGGEAVSLSAVENVIDPFLPDDAECVCVAFPDERKGEKIILLITGVEEIDKLKSKLRKSDISSLMLPSDIIAINQIPKLGSGKTNFSAAKELALHLMG